MVPGYYEPQRHFVWDLEVEIKQQSYVYFFMLGRSVKTMRCCHGLLMLSLVCSLIMWEELTASAKSIGSSFTLSDPWGQVHVQLHAEGFQLLLHHWSVLLGGEETPMWIPVTLYEFSSILTDFSLLWLYPLCVHLFFSLAFPANFRFLYTERAASHRLFN